VLWLIGVQLWYVGGAAAVQQLHGSSLHIHSLLQKGFITAAAAAAAIDPLLKGLRECNPNQRVEAHMHTHTEVAWYRQGHGMS
jgi:hypothetical protein